MLYDFPTRLEEAARHVLWKDIRMMTVFMTIGAIANTAWHAIAGSAMPGARAFAYYYAAGMLAGTGAWIVLYFLCGLGSKALRFYAAEQEEIARLTSQRIAHMTFLLKLKAALTLIWPLGLVVLMIDQALKSHDLRAGWNKLPPAR